MRGRKFVVERQRTFGGGPRLLVTIIVELTQRATFDPHPRCGWVEVDRVVERDERLGVLVNRVSAPPR